MVASGKRRPNVAGRFQRLCSTRTARSSTCTPSRASPNRFSPARARRSPRRGARSSSSTRGCAASWSATRTSAASRSPRSSGRSSHLGLEADEAQRRAAHRRVPPPRDVPRGARGARGARAARGRSRSCPTATPRCSRRSSTTTGLRDRFRGGVLSVHSAKTFKPAPGGLPPGRGPAGRAALDDGVRLVERLGRGRRQDLRLPGVLGEPRRRAGGAPGRAARRDRSRTSPGPGRCAPVA